MTFGERGELAEPTVEPSCYEKAKAKGAPMFTLVASDITADLTVEAWADMQRLLMQFLRRGYTLTQALNQIKAHLLPLKQACEPQPTTKKVDEAYAIAKRMAQWGSRKIAD